MQQMDSIELEIPSRICLIGDKIDLAGLPVIGAAVFPSLTIQISRLSEKRVILESNLCQEPLKITLHSKENFDHPLKYWCAIISRLHDRIGGFHAVMQSNIPVGAGLSSSAAISVGLISGLNELFALQLSRMEIAELAYQIEHDDLGIMCGRMDQYSIAFGGISFINTSDSPVVVPITIDSLPFIIIDSKEPRQAKYILRDYKQRLKDRDSILLHAIDKIHTGVKTCKTIIETKDLRSLGNLMNCQQNFENQLGYSTKKIQKICKKAVDSGAYGAKQIGAGGGGCVIVLFELNHPNRQKFIDEVVKWDINIWDADIFHF